MDHYKHLLNYVLLALFLQGFCTFCCLKQCYMNDGLGYFEPIFTLQFQIKICNVLTEIYTAQIVHLLILSIRYRDHANPSKIFKHIFPVLISYMLNLSSISHNIFVGLTQYSQCRTTCTSLSRYKYFCLKYSWPGQTDKRME